MRALLALFNRMTDIVTTVHARYTGTGKFPSVFSGIRTYSFFVLQAMQICRNSKHNFGHFVGVIY